MTQPDDPAESLGLLLAEHLASCGRRTKQERPMASDNSEGPPLEADRRPVLEWTKDPGADGCLVHWRACVGDFLHLVVVGLHDSDSWYVWDVAHISREAASLVDAQLAAEAAAVQLLIGALGAFLVRLGPDACINWDIDGEAGMGTYDDYAKASPDDAIALGRALICAALAAREGSP